MDKIPHEDETLVQLVIRELNENIDTLDENTASLKIKLAPVLARKDLPDNLVKEEENNFSNFSPLVAELKKLNKMINCIKLQVDYMHEQLEI